MKDDRRGFTIVEVLIAVMVLSVGVLALASAGGLTFRMLGQGHRSTAAGQMALNRLERMRRVANATSPRCTALSTGTATHPNGSSETWSVSGTGNSRNVRVIVTYQTMHGPAVDTTNSILDCH